MGRILGQYWLMPILVQHWVEILDQYPVLLGLLNIYKCGLQNVGKLTSRQIVVGPWCQQ